MAITVNPQQYYQQEISLLTTRLSNLQKRKQLLGWVRFLVLIAAAVLCWLLWSTGVLFAVIAFITGLVAFLYIVKKDIANNEAIQHLQRLNRINEEELLYLQHRYTHQKDGAEFYYDEHVYAGDLDIFGRASLYQYINRTKSQQGNQLMSKWLLSPAAADTINARQKAVHELAEKTNWCRELQAHGLSSTITVATEKKLEDWLTEENQFAQKPIWHIIR
ncbi:MAG: hypothetical protein GXC73_03810, partial [Chitinophagaceae bacterium]|nr:hypothetical protein [Chitinophagaceae bacterium]